MQAHVMSLTQLISSGKRSSHQLYLTSALILRRNGLRSKYLNQSKDTIQRGAVRTDLESFLEVSLRFYF